MIFELLHEKEEEELINRFIHKVMGKEWFEMPHYWRYPDPNPNYLEHGKPWGDMLRWSREQDWWSDFKHRVLINHDKYDYTPLLIAVENTIDLFADQTALATAITKYLKELKEI